MAARGNRHVPRVYLEQRIASQASMTLGRDKSHHLRNVLRLKTDDAVVIFDGHGGEYTSRIVAAQRQSVTLAVGQQTHCRRESALPLALAQGIARGDRMDFAISKAVELGVSTIQPLFTQRCKVKLAGQRLTKKLSHWRRVAISAAEQSGREQVPTINVPMNCHDFLQSSPPACGLVLSPAAKTTLRQIAPQDAATLLVGPEAGLADIELQSALDAGYRAVTLGPRTLRTETAGMACLAALQTLWGDLA